MPTHISSLTQLRQFNASIEEGGGTLVFTNGCFDVLHVGHVRYLQAARAMGDALAVAVNSDRTVRELKGPRRPFVPEVERAEMLAALKSVDYVVVFDSMTAEHIVANVQPGVYVKGGDYSANQHDQNFPPEARIVLRYGGKVVIVPTVLDRSTSRLMDAIDLQTHTIG